MAPKLGLRPITPLKAAGRITEPSVCVPTASGTSPAATAAAEPAEDPPGVCAGFLGLRVGAGGRGATAVVADFPTTIAPACRRAATIPASDIDGARPA